MAIIVNLDIMMARRKISLGELAEKVDITPANLSILKTGKAKAIRFSTLEAICKELDCQPGDILEYKEGDWSSDVCSSDLVQFSLQMNRIRKPFLQESQLMVEVPGYYPDK